MISLTDSNTEKFLYSVLKRLSASMYAKSQIVAAVTPNFVDSLKSRGWLTLGLFQMGLTLRFLNDMTKISLEESWDWVIMISLLFTVEA